MDIQSRTIITEN